MQWKGIFTYRKKDTCARDVNGSKQLYYWCSGTLIFLECNSMLNAAAVTNAFLSYNWLSKCFFSVFFFFFYILTTFLFYRLFDNVLMKTYSLCGRCNDKKAFKETTVVWSVFPAIVLNQRIFAVLILKPSFNFLGPTMKSQTWSKSEALGPNYTFKNGLAEYYTVCSNKCIIKSFKFLANNLDIHFFGQIIY